MALRGRQIVLALCVACASLVASPPRAGAGALIEPETLSSIFHGDAPVLPSTPQTLSSIEQDVARMKQMDPDFTTWPDAFGIVWLKRASFARARDGGMEEERLWAILGRRGLDERWLTWNVPDPPGGEAEILEASVWSFETGRKVADVPTSHEGGLHVVRAGDMTLPEPFILVLAWRTTRHEQLSIEGLAWTQEELPVWESIVEVSVPSEGASPLVHRAFPQPMSPEVEDDGAERSYTWRRINVPPLTRTGLAVEPRAGVAFSMRTDSPAGGAGMVRLMKDTVTPPCPAPPAAFEGFRKSKGEGALRLLSWLRDQPEIRVEGLRAVPTSGPWTREEKLALACAWLREQGVDASLMWRMPIELDDAPPLSAELLQGPVLELPAMEGPKGTSAESFYDMAGPPSWGTPPLLQGAKLVGLSDGGRPIRKKIPSAKADEARLSVVMDLKLDTQGALRGPVRAMLRGAWGTLLLPSPSPSQDELQGVVRALFPGLQSYGELKLRRVKGVPELSFQLEGKPGVSGSGQGVLGMPPLFEPVALRALEDVAPPFELRFPFIVEQSLTIGLPKGAGPALISGNVPRGADKIAYSESYKNRRNRLVAEARLEARGTDVRVDDMGLLRQCLARWRRFSTRPIPVQVR